MDLAEVSTLMGLDPLLLGICEIAQLSSIDSAVLVSLDMGQDNGWLLRLFPLLFLFFGLSA